MIAGKVIYIEAIIYNYFLLDCITVYIQKLKKFKILYSQNIYTMKLNNFAYRFKKARNKHGIKSFPRLIFKKILLVVRDKWRLLFNYYNYVFIYDGEPPRVILPEGITIKFYDKLEKIPKEALQKMIDEMGGKTIDWLNSEFKAGSTLWLLFINDAFIVRQLVRYGKFFDKWFLPLNDMDFVFMAGSTFPEYRGQGLIGILTNYQMSHLMRNGGKPFADCKVWNKSSRRFLEKIGFRRIKTMKNYWEGNGTKDKILTFMNKLLK